MDSGVATSSGQNPDGEDAPRQPRGEDQMMQVQKLGVGFLPKVKRELGMDSPVPEPADKKAKAKDFFIGTPAEPAYKKVKVVAMVQKEWTPYEEPSWDDAWCEGSLGEAPELTDEMRR